MAVKKTPIPKKEETKHMKVTKTETVGNTISQTLEEVKVETKEDTSLTAFKELAKEIMKLNALVQELKAKVEALEEYNSSQGYVIK